LTGSPELIARRQAGRPAHFMPSTLLESQFATLEPLGPNESGVAVDVGQSVESIVETFLEYLDTRRRG
jgi:gluconokinase